MMEYLARRFPEKLLFGLARNESSLRSGNLDGVLDKIKVVFCELQSLQSVSAALLQIRPDEVYHFASNADVLYSFKNPSEVLNNNIACTLNLFEACRQNDLKPKILLCSTSEVYGQVQPHEVPISESNPLRPASPYAVSKTTQDLLADVYFKAYGLPVVRTRMFTYINPRRANLFATSFALQVARIEAGLQNELSHGNLESVRTHFDVRDMAAAYAEVMEKGLPGEIYNLGGKSSFTVGEFLSLLIKSAKTEITCRPDPALFRPQDVTLQIPDVSKFENLTSWRPQYSLQDSIALLLDECRQRVKKAN